MRKFKERFLEKKAATQQQAEAESSRLSSSDSPPVLPFPDGIQVLHDCTDAVVDICFVHGLAGNRASTWTANGQSQPWPQAFLGPKLEKARILTYGYDAYPVRQSAASSNRLIDHSTNLLIDLTTDRASCNNASGRPIIFVAHSLGGLVCKETILLSRNNPEVHRKKIFDCTKGIIFMGTPHTGSWMADWAKVPASALGIFKRPNKSLLNILETDNQLLESIQIRFLAMIRDLRECNRRLEVACFFEELPLPVVGKVVSKNSATFDGYDPISIHANHGDMVKFASAKETGYRRVLGELTRWEAELRSSTTIEPSPSIEPIPSSARKVIFAMPFKPDPHYISRDTLSSSIKEQLEAHQRAVLWGMGGTGKSQIAIAYVHQYHQKYPQSHIFWIYAATRSRFVQECQRMARQLHLPGCDDPTRDACELVERWLDDEENGPWLLIVDNADDVDLMLGPVASCESDTDRESPTKPLIAYLPRIVDRSRRLLITTRNKDVADDLTESSSPIHVGPFSLAEARILLRRKITKEESPPDNIMDELLESLAFLPLAITQAAAFCERNPMTIAQYLTTFKASESERMTQLSINLQDRCREPGYPNSVFLTWRLSFDQMRQRDRAAAKLLALLAFLDGQSIPLSLIQKPQEMQADRSHALGTVAGYSLVVVAADQTVSMHPLVQESVRYWLGQQEKASSVEQAVQLLASNFPDGDYDSWVACQTLLPHAQAALRHRAGVNLTSENRAFLQHKVSGFCYKSGQYGMALEHIKESYDIRVALFGDENQRSLRSLTVKALILDMQGEYKQAEELNRQALIGYKKELRENHPEILVTMSNLATVLADQGKYEQAEELNRQVLTGREKELRENHPDILVTISNLAVVLADQGKSEQAEELIRQVLIGYKKELRENHPEILGTMSNLATVLADQGKYEQAEELNRQVLTGREKELRENHPEILRIMSNLATVLADQGKYEQAEELNRQALTGREKELGENHPDTLRSVGLLAYLLDKKQDRHEALRLYDCAVDGLTKTLGPAHPDTQECQRHRASLLESMKEHPL